MTVKFLFFHTVEMVQTVKEKNTFDDENSFSVVLEIDTIFSVICVL